MYDIVKPEPLSEAPSLGKWRVYVVWNNCYGQLSNTTSTNLTYVLSQMKTIKGNADIVVDFQSSCSTGEGSLKKCVSLYSKDGSSAVVLSLLLMRANIFLDKNNCDFKNIYGF